MHLRKVGRPPALFGWLALGLALYCLSSLIGQWRTAGWSEIPAEGVSWKPTVRPEITRGSLGRPRGMHFRTQWELRYRYEVYGHTYSGSWRGGEVAQPATVLYDPVDPSRSTLRRPPPSPTVQALGWGCLVLAVGIFAWRRTGGGAHGEDRTEHAPPGVAGAADLPAGSELPTGKERWAFRALVLLDVVLALVRRTMDTVVDGLPPEIREQLEGHLPASPLQEMFLDLNPVALGLSVVAVFGLLTFWAPARRLYAITWCWWLANTWFGAAFLSYGIDGALLQLGRLVGGAIVALSFCGPIGRAFTLPKQPEEAPE